MYSYANYQNVVIIVDNTVASIVSSWDSCYVE